MIRRGIPYVGTVQGAKSSTCNSGFSFINCTMTPENTIPLINITPFLDPSSSQECKDSIVNQTRDACENYGFFQLVGHGVPVEVQRGILKCAETFFDLPYEEKWEMRMENALGKCGRGYEKIGGQTLQKNGRPDLKEVI